METNKILESKAFLVVMSLIFGLVLLVGSFALGIAVGYHKADFSYKWGDNYRMNFGGERPGFVSDLGSRDFVDAHGTAGQLIKIDGQTLVLNGRDNVEKIVTINPDTTIRGPRSSIKASDLTIDDQMVVIGNPNASGQIEAKFIRVMPRAAYTPSGLPMMKHK